MELEFIRWLREHVPRDARLPQGLGDDAGVLAIAGRGPLVVTSDLISDGVDFRLEHDDPRLIGRKSLAINLSDLGAMATVPQAAVVSIALPRTPPSMSQFELAVALYEGLIPLAKEYDVAIAGGDTNTHDGPLVISITAIGQATKRGPLTRGGGRVGDWLLVTGQLGGSITGHHLSFTPRVREALLLHERYELHAGMDVSDGLALDLARLAAESACGAVLMTDQLPISDATRSLAARHPSDATPVQHALGDGEDFELLLAAPPEAAQAMLRDQPVECGLTHIGELIDGEHLWQQVGPETRLPLEPSGWQH